MKTLVMAPALFLLSVVVSLAQSETAFNGYQRLTNREIALTLGGPTGFTYRVQTSTNLSNWSALATLAATNISLSHTDSAAPYLPQRFYRAEQLPAGVLTGDHFSTTNGEVVVHVRNHATFIMTWQGKTIYCDPVSGGGPYTALPKADLLLVTHSHSDHFSASTLNSVRAANGIILAPLAVYNDGSMPALRSVTGVLTNGMSTNLLGLSVEAVPAYNGDHPKGSGNGYVVGLGGKRFYLSGDTGDVPEMRMLPNIEAAFVCMNVPYTMTVADAAAAVRAFQPRVVYPYHYRNSDQTLADLADFKRRVGQDLGIEVRLRKWY